MKHKYTYFHENVRNNQYDNLYFVDVVIRKDNTECHRETIDYRNDGYLIPHDVAFKVNEIYQRRAKQLISKFEEEDYLAERSEIIAEFAQQFPEFEKNRELIIMELIADKVISYMRETHKDE